MTIELDEADRLRAEGARRTAALVAAVRRLEGGALEEPSLLPGWARGRGCPPARARPASTPMGRESTRGGPGRARLVRLALSRLTEVDVHGGDLGIGFDDWSDTLVDVALPTRLGWLSTRRSNHRAFDATLRGTWLLRSLDGFAWSVTVDGDAVRADPAEAGAPPAPSATIEGSRRDLLALLLGRPPVAELVVTGDVSFGDAFARAFPGP